MIKDIWINLPVKNVARSREFFAQLGFSFDDKHGVNPTCMLVGEKKMVVMLFQDDMVKGFMKQDVTDTAKSNEMLLSIGAGSREQVDDLVRMAGAAGGIIFSEPGESQGWLYGAGFADPDGHRWNVLYMDMAKMPGK